MIFLIEYDRDQGEIVLMREFGESEKQNADTARLDLELQLNLHRIEHEVVLLEARNETALRQTHRRYFENLSELVKPS
ncbi:MAG TPA: hypothetical protein DC054_10900 [Blastocatellia bacterium]|nr:hypothetical protein [Blastocatellia bacterium]